MAGLEGKTFVEKYILEPRYVTNANGDTTHYYTEYVDIDSTRFKNEGRYCYVSARGYFEYYIYGHLIRRSPKIKEIFIRSDGAFMIRFENSPSDHFIWDFLPDTLNGQVVYDINGEYGDISDNYWSWNGSYTNGMPKNEVDILRNDSRFVLE